MNRRRFLDTTSSLISGSLLSCNLSIRLPIWDLEMDNPYAETIGLQLWTVRNQLEEDQQKTLEAVAAAGYKQVELMDTNQAEVLLPICDDLGLKVTSAFINWNAICNPDAKGTPSLDEILEQAKQADLQHLVFGYIGKGHRETADHFKRHAEASNRFGERCQAAGIQLCYHNHAFEFAALELEATGDANNSKSTTGFDILMSDFERGLCDFELDVFWAAIGGWDPIETLRKLNGRVTQVHLKDLKADIGKIYDEGKVPHEAFEELGDGVIDMEKVIEVSAEIGVKQCHVEQDQSPNPIASIGQSMKHFRGISM